MTEDYGPEPPALCSQSGMVLNFEEQRVIFRGKLLRRMFISSSRIGAERENLDLPRCRPRFRLRRGAIASGLAHH